MTMQPITRYTLETHAGPYQRWPDSSRLIVDGRAVDARVPGYVVEAQYETAFGMLLVTSFDCPYEEANRFLLLDDRHRIVVETELSTMYGSWLLHAHWPVAADTLALHYHADVFLTLQIDADSGGRRRGPRLRLQRFDAWREDPTMVESHAQLVIALEAIQS